MPSDNFSRAIASAFHAFQLLYTSFRFNSTIKLICMCIYKALIVFVLIINVAVIHLHSRARLSLRGRGTNYNVTRPQHTLYNYDVHCQQQALHIVLQIGDTCQFIRRSLNLQDMLVFTVVFIHQRIITWE